MPILHDLVVIPEVILVGLRLRDRVDLLHWGRNLRHWHSFHLHFFLPSSSLESRRNHWLIWLNHHCLHLHFYWLLLGALSHHFQVALDHLRIIVDDALRGVALPQHDFFLLLWALRDLEGELVHLEVLLVFYLFHLEAFWPASLLRDLLNWLWLAVEWDSEQLRSLC